MVYLIDDKKYRQEHDYHWDSAMFNNFSNVIKPIYNLKELINYREQIFQSQNTVLYHESFLDNTTSSSTSQQKRIELEKFAEKNPEFNLAIFSGSKFSRNLVNKIAHLPVAILYSNLASFLSKLNAGENNLNYLLFGDSPLIEKHLNDKLNEALSKIEKEHPAKIKDKNNLVLRPVKGQIQNAIEDADEKVLFNKDLSDQKLSEYIDEWLDDTKYDNIFIPLCFGSILSDFNGLRLATHIRCTDTINQLSRIYIYGYAEIEYLLNHECFNILKTKNIQLIPFSRSAIEKAGNLSEHEFTKEFLYEEIMKLKLDVPKDYDDNHSINNEWAISQWTYCIPEPIYERVENVLNKVENRLYFKYLNTLRSTQVIQSLKEEDLKISKANKQRVLLIDNDYKKGWQALFNYILTECNNLQMDTLEIDYRAATRQEIINSAYNKVVNPTTQSINYDVVILDFRLHPSDNDETNIDLITGTQILKRLKAFNPGIQVIIFSATNKIWNLQALQVEKADAFIIKEGHEISFNSEFTSHSISNMIEQLGLCLSKSHLKYIYSVLSPLIEKVRMNTLKKPKHYQLTIPQGKITDYLDYLTSADFLLYSNPHNLKYCFLQLILIIEDIIKNFYVENYDGNHYIKWSMEEPVLSLDKSGFRTKLKLKPLNRWNKFICEDYIIEDNKEESMFNAQADRIPFNYRLNCVLYFKYGVDLDTASKYSKLYKLRSSSVAHIGDSDISVAHLLNSIELLNILIK
jgi:CheY-like chemotaxis protein